MTRIHFIIRSLKCWLSPIGLHCELCLMLEVAASLHPHLKSAVTADCCNLMIGLMHNDFITVSLRAALDAAASPVSRFPRIDRLHFDVVWSLWQCWLLWLNHWSRRLNFPPRVIREPYILVRFWTLSLWSRVIRGSACTRVYTVTIVSVTLASLCNLSLHRWRSDQQHSNHPRGDRQFRSRLCYYHGEGL